MDTQLKAKWLQALRGEEYSQATDHLHDARNGGYCCLGVLCKVMGAEFGPGSEEQEDDDGQVILREFDYVPVLDGRILSSNEDEELKDSLCKELGIVDQSILIGMNDGTISGSHKHSFAEIADYIEKNL
jgi:hypothetical protein